MKLVYMLTQTIFNIFLFLGRIWKQSVKELNVKHSTTETMNGLSYYFVLLFLLVKHGNKKTESFALENISKEII